MLRKPANNEPMSRRHLASIALSAEEIASQARLSRHVEVLASLIGPRSVHERYDMLQAAERYVRDELTKSGLNVESQEYVVAGRTVRNLIAEQRGAARADELLVLGAHYDSVGSTPGADDNASAVAGLLEIAHQLSARKFQRTIRYVAFVNEEPPFYKSENMGSLRYARACRERGDRIVGMINLEMIGYFTDADGSQAYPPLGALRKVLPDRGNFIVICSDLASTRFLAKVAWGFRRSGVRFPMIPFPAPRSVPGPDMSDNWSFWQCGYPAVMVTDTSFLRNPHYHRPSDLPATLHFPAMTRVVAGVSSSLARLAKAT